MKQNNLSFAFERFWECLECNEPISNPLCPVCLTKQVEVWLSSYPSDIQNKIIGDISGYVKKTNNLVENKVRCVVCNKKEASLCPYCFTNYVFNLLKRLKVHRTILKEFLMFFNFDFGHTGYSKDAERLGVI